MSRPNLSSIGNSSSAHRTVGGAAARRPVGGAAASPAGGGGPAMPPPATTVPPPVTPKQLLLYEAYRLGKLGVDDKAAIVTSLKNLTFSKIDSASLLKIEIHLQTELDHPITSILCENKDQRDAIMKSLEIIKKAAIAVSPSDLATLAKHFDGMVKSGLDKLLIDCCVKADEKNACTRACASIAALPEDSLTLERDFKTLLVDKARQSQLLNSEATNNRLSQHQELTQATEKLRLEIQALQHSQLSTPVEIDGRDATLREVSTYNAKIHEQNTSLATQKDAIVELGKHIQLEKQKTASSLDPQKVALDARHVVLEKQFQILSTIKCNLTDAISGLDVMITASNSGPLAHVSTELVEAALRNVAQTQLSTLSTTLKTKDASGFLGAITAVQEVIRDKTRELTAAAFDYLYGNYNARPAETDAAIDACLTSIKQELETFDAQYTTYRKDKDTYEKDVATFNSEKDAALTAVNALVERQAKDISTLSTLAESLFQNPEKLGLTEKINKLNAAIQEKQPVSLVRTAELNTKIIQYNQNIGRLQALEQEQQALVCAVSTSNAAIAAYNKDVDALKAEVSVAKSQKAHIERYNNSTSVQNNRNKITLEVMEKAPSIIAEFKAKLQQSSPTSSAGASGSDPYLLMSYDTRTEFTPIDFSELKIPPRIPQIACRSLSSSFAPIPVATVMGTETIQATLSAVKVEIPQPEDYVSDITVQAATDIVREFPSIGMLAKPNQRVITVEAPFITTEMLKTHGDALKAMKVSEERQKKWGQLIDAVGTSKGPKATCPVKMEAQQRWANKLMNQETDLVWLSTLGPDGKYHVRYRLEFDMTAKPKAGTSETGIERLNSEIAALKILAIGSNVF